MQNKNLQAAVNALQMQMAGDIPPNGPTFNAVTRQQPPTQNTGQQQAPPQCGKYNGSEYVDPWQAPPTQPQYYQQHQQHQHGNFQPLGSCRQRDRVRRGYGRGNGFGGMHAQGGGQNPQQMQNPRFTAEGIQNQTNWNTHTRAGCTNNKRSGQQGQRQQQWHNNHQGAFQQQPNRAPFMNVRPLCTNFSYCHTHGYAVSAQHNSATCKDQAPGHQWQGTRQNTMGGSPTGGHIMNM